ncbi:MAG: CDP-alcohol phosphatidyltransferase [Rubritepida sp.]|nr:CDP-alcohol phosphatidyltransferase [Rubritepida sp.]
MAEADRPLPMSQGEPPAHILLTLPNLITLARLAAVPGTVWLILHHRLDLAFMLFVAAGISDGLDGWLARYTNSRSAIGALLDPVADKVLLVSVYVTLAAIQVLPDWLAILVVFRDLVIVGGLVVLWMLGAKAAIRPLYISKLNTALQLLLAALALFVAGFGMPLDTAMTVLIWLVAASTLGSGLAYVVSAGRRLAGPRA